MTLTACAVFGTGDIFGGSQEAPQPTWQGIEPQEVLKPVQGRECSLVM